MRSAIALALLALPLFGCLPPLPDKGEPGETLGDEPTEGTSNAEVIGDDDGPIEGDDGSMPMDDSDLPMDDGDDGGGALPDLGDGGDDSDDSDGPGDGSTGAEPYCGDGIIDGFEACDGGDHDGQTCQSLGYGGGVLVCRPDCSQFDTTGCGPMATNCCEARTVPGCDQPDVQACVCASDSYCCETAWDATCVAASSSCGAVCD